MLGYSAGVKAIDDPSVQTGGMSGRRRRLLMGAASLVAAPWVHSQPRQPQKVIYPAPLSALDSRSDDLVALLRAALERTEPSHGPFELQPSIPLETLARQIVQLEHGAGLSVIWASPSAVPERGLRPVRVPTRRGLLGFRVALIHERNQAALRRVRDVDGLRRFALGQGSSWPEVAMYRAHGFQVETGNYEALFRMLHQGRFDLFPRGVNEVFAEQAARAAQLPGLVVENSLLIHYPLPYYFYCHRDDQALAARLEQGLRAMVRDGSYEAHFWRFHGDAIRQARLQERRLIRLSNPQLAPGTVPSDPALWLDPVALTRR